MEFRIADTFTVSLAKLTAPEQKTAKTTAFDLQLDPAGSGKQFHRIERIRDPHFWSVRVNYRTSHQIRSQADRLLPSELPDVDQNAESRKGTISVFNGPPPTIETFDDAKAEQTGVGTWIAARIADGVLPQEIAIFVRSDAEIPRARKAAKAAGVPAVVLNKRIETEAGKLSLSAMHLAKGLGFRAVIVMACDGEVIPLQERMESVADDADLEEVYDTERHLLYVACTRARDHLMVSGVDPASEFLDDLATPGVGGAS